MATSTSTLINQTITSTSTTTTTVTTSIVSVPRPPPSLRPQQKRLYFAYGSNLSPTQMAARCPGAVARHLAWAGGWRFLVNARGYANVVPEAVFGARDGRFAPGVYGVLYEIGAADEAALDAAEGVPWAYEKVEMLVWVRRRGEGGREEEGGEGEGLGRMALVYVDRRRTTPGAPEDEYVVRMNRGIREVREAGVVAPLPEWYVNEVLREFIPEEDPE